MFILGICPVVFCLVANCTQFMLCTETKNCLLCVLINVWERKTYQP